MSSCLIGDDLYGTVAPPGDIRSISGPTILSQYSNDYHRADWQGANDFDRTRWPEGRNPVHPPLKSSFARPAVQTRAPFTNGSRCSTSMVEQDDCAQRRQQLTDVGTRIYNNNSCQMPAPTTDPSPMLCPQEILWQAGWVGTAPMFIPVANDQCSNPASCIPTHRWEKIYRNPQEWQEIYAKRAMEDGREWNPYQHMAARQKMLQFIAADFAPRRGDPHTIPLARPEPGIATLAEIKMQQQIPHPQF